MALHKHPLSIAGQRSALSHIASAPTTPTLVDEQAEIAQLPWMIRLTIVCLAATARLGRLEHAAWSAGLAALAALCGRLYDWRLL